MHIAYLDDSGTHLKSKRKFQLMTAVLFEGWEFNNIELALGAAIEYLVPTEKWESFEEFHAWKLFGGFGAFEGVDENRRLGAIQGLLNVVTSHAVPIIYSAVDTDKLSGDLYGSAEPLDVCFRLCMQGVENWAATNIVGPASTESLKEQSKHPLVVLVCDDFSQKGLKEALRKSFRHARSKLRPPQYNSRAWHLHDDLYFGNSKDSIGIQLADICGHIIRRHLENDERVANFYDVIKKHIIFDRVEPSIYQNQSKDKSSSDGL